jgi:hypothetical protein
MAQAALGDYSKDSRLGTIRASASGSGTDCGNRLDAVACAESREMTAADEGGVAGARGQPGSRDERSAIAGGDQPAESYADDSSSCPPPAPRSLGVSRHNAGLGISRLMRMSS